MPVDGVMPQCVIRRTWTSLNRSSSQMCGLSGGVVSSSTSFGGSSVRSQLIPFSPAWAVTIVVFRTLPPASRISIFTGPAGAVASASWKCGRLACWNTLRAWRMIGAGSYSFVVPGAGGAGCPVCSSSVMFGRM